MQFWTYYLINSLLFFILFLACKSISFTFINDLEECNTLKYMKIYVKEQTFYFNSVLSWNYLILFTLSTLSALLSCYF